MIWQLLQIGHLKGTPLILPGKSTQSLLPGCRHHMLRPELNLARPEDMAFPP